MGRSPRAWALRSSSTLAGRAQTGMFLLFVDESEELKSRRVIISQAWQVFDLHSQLLSINVTFVSCPLGVVTIPDHPVLGS